MGDANYERASAKQMSQYNFSSDELRVLAECGKESFYKRSLPIGTTLGMITYTAVKSGYLSGNARFGSIPKVFGACVIGYMIGKFSYRNECIKKIMELPNSELAEQLRKKMNIQGSQGYFQQIDASFPSYDQEKSTSNSMNSSLDIDTDRPSFSTNDEDLYRPTGDTYIPNNDITAFKSNISYDDLRKQNREPSTPISSFRNFETSRPPQKTYEKDDTNKYGDTLN